MMPPDLEFGWTAVARWTTAEYLVLADELEESGDRAQAALVREHARQLALEAMQIGAAGR